MPQRSVDPATIRSVPDGWQVLRVVRKKRTYAECVCACGRTGMIPVNLSGELRSSRCVLCSVTKGKFNLTHGHCVDRALTPTYRSYTAMLSRCSNPNATGFSRYGGRGVVVDESWRESYESFLADVGERPSPQHSLDRFPDRNGDYVPGNVRWATRSEQQRNRDDNRILQYNGESLPAVAWAERFGMRGSSLLKRIDAGWSVERALTTPFRKQTGKQT